MKLIIAGSRDFTDRLAFGQYIEAIDLCGVTEIISGGCKGVDRMGENIACEEQIPVKWFNANWNEHGKAAGPIRNKQMAEYADALFCIRYHDSRGSASMVAEAMKAGLFIVDVVLPRPKGGGA